MESRQAKGFNGYTTIVESQFGHETWQVRLEHAVEGWSATIYTLPSRVWTRRGSRDPLRFRGETWKEAEEKAAQYMAAEGVRTRSRLGRPYGRDRLSAHTSVPSEAPPVSPGAGRGDGAAGDAPSRQGVDAGPRNSIPQTGPSTHALGPKIRDAGPGRRKEPAPRIARRFLVRFGTSGCQWPGVTSNLSETGIFIITDRPMRAGDQIDIDLRFPSGAVLLRGGIVWMRQRKEEGRSIGLGVRLIDPPKAYLANLRALY